MSLRSRMARRAFVHLIVSVPILAVALVPPDAALPEDRQARVVSVVDGDTLSVLVDRGRLTVRLHGVDCPEKGQVFGRQAKQFTAKLAAGQAITLRERGFDSRGLMTVEVVLPDGRSLNEELLTAGLGWWFDQHSDDVTWGFLEEEARLSRRGLWSQPLPVPPWEWRDRQAGPHAPAGTR